MTSPDFSEIPNNQPGDNSSEFNLFELVSVLTKHAKFIVYAMCIVVGVTIAALLITSNKYTSTASILPSGTSDKLSELNSLAGLGISSINNENSSVLFPSILKSRQIARAVLSAEYLFQDNDKQVTLTLQEYFGESDFDKLFLKLNDISSFSTDKKTEVIRLSVETKHSAFSQALVAKYLSELENYTIYKRRSKAKENEVYLAKQLTTIKKELSLAEDEREKFQAENSNWHMSSNSEIIKTLSGLEREVEIKSSIYLFLTQEYENAKFEAQKDVPIIQILDNPSLPTQKSSPKRTLILLFITFVSFFIIIFIILVSEALLKYSRNQGKEPSAKIKSDLQKHFPAISKFIQGKINQ